jgi:hypothetical protein
MHQMTPRNLSQKAYVKGSTRKLIERGRVVYVGRFINKSRLLNKTSSLSKESVQIVKILLQLFNNQGRGSLSLEWAGF